jgi:hypothetical protein
LFQGVLVCTREWYINVVPWCVLDTLGLPCRISRASRCTSAPPTVWPLPYALTPNTVELIPTLGALFPRGGPVQDPVLTPAPHTCSPSPTPAPHTQTLTPNPKPSPQTPNPQPKTLSAHTRPKTLSTHPQPKTFSAGGEKRDVTVAMTRGAGGSRIRHRPCAFFPPS